MDAEPDFMAHINGATESTKVLERTPIGSVLAEALLVTEEAHAAVEKKKAVEKAHKVARTAELSAKAKEQLEELLKKSKAGRIVHDAKVAERKAALDAKARGTLAGLLALSEAAATSVAATPAPEKKPKRERKKREKKETKKGKVVALCRGCAQNADYARSGTLEDPIPLSEVRFHRGCNLAGAATDDVRHVHGELIVALTAEEVEALERSVAYGERCPDHVSRGGPNGLLPIKYVG